jgi:hypothetical protein
VVAYDVCWAFGNAEKIAAKSQTLSDLLKEGCRRDPGPLTSRCSGRGYREPFKVRFSFTVVLVVVGYAVSAATPLRSHLLDGE